MSELSDVLARVNGEHEVALRWFLENTGRTVTWSEMKAYADKGARLVNQAKGIYKPHYTDCALSVRQTLDGPYADKEVERRPDGSWAYSYFQENPNPAERDKEATNRGLVLCMKQGIPVGVLLQNKPKPGVTYEVLGLAAVTEWKDGYFILEGYSREGRVHATNERPDAAHDRARAAAAPLPTQDFDPAAVGDGRDRQIAQVIRRRGQAGFRAALLSAYDGRCAVTGCDAADALEAAHISAYRGADSNHPQNGLLLRADIHSLFDLGLLSIDPSKMVVVLADELRSSTYAALAGATLTMPKEVSLRPSRVALAEHLKWSGLQGK